MPGRKVLVRTRKKTERIMDGHPFTNRGRVAYGDPSASGRGMTEIVSSQIVHSAAREPRVEGNRVSTPGEYVYRLPGAKRNTTAVQVGSFVLGEDPRLPFDATRMHFQVAEPVTLRENTSVTINVVETWYSLTSRGEREFDSVSTASAVFAFPKTYQYASITSQANADDGVYEVEFPHQLFTFNPPTEQAPELRSTEVRWRSSEGLPHEVVSLDDTTSLTGTATQFQLYPLRSVTGYLAELDNTRKGGVSGTLTSVTSVSALYASPAHTYGYPSTLSSVLAMPKYLVNELAQAVDNNFSYRLTEGELPIRLNATLSSVTGEFAMWMNPGDETQTGRGFYVQRSVNIAGMQDNDVFDALGVSGGSLNIPSGGKAFTSYPNAVRTIRIPEGSLSSAADLIEVMNRQTNPLNISHTLTEDQRTLYLRDQAGSESSITYMPGRYNLATFRQYTDELLNDAGSTFVETQVHDGRIQFVTRTGTPFRLYMNQSPELAKVLHFEPREYHETVSAPLRREVLNGWYIDEGRSRALRRPIRWSTMSTAEPRLVAHSGTWAPPDEESGLYLTSISTVSDDTLRGYIVYMNGGVETDYAVPCADGDYVSLFNTVTSATDITEAPLPFRGVVTSNQVKAAPNRVDIFMGRGLVSLFGDEDDTPTGTTAITSDTTLSIFLDDRTDFLVNGARPPSSVAFGEKDYTGSGVRADYTRGELVQTSGRGSVYGPAESQLGMGAVVSASAAGRLVMPSVYSLSPPRIVLVELVSPDNRSSLHEYRAPADRPMSFVPSTDLTTSTDGTGKIIAAIAITNGFARISEEMTHVDSLGPMDVSQVHLRFLNPDMSVVDWRGVDHFLTLLFRQSMGRVTGSTVY